MPPQLIISLITLGAKYGPDVIDAIKRAVAARNPRVDLAEIDQVFTIIHQLSSLEAYEAAAGVKVEDDGSVKPQA